MLDKYLIPAEKKFVSFFSSDEPKAKDLRQEIEENIGKAKAESEEDKKEVIIETINQLGNKFEEVLAPLEEVYREIGEHNEVKESIARAYFKVAEIFFAEKDNFHDPSDVEIYEGLLKLAKKYYDKSFKMNKENLDVLNKKIVVMRLFGAEFDQERAKDAETFYQLKCEDIERKINNLSFDLMFF